MQISPKQPNLWKLTQFAWVQLQRNTFHIFTNIVIADQILLNRCIILLGLGLSIIVDISKLHVSTVKGVLHLTKPRYPDIQFNPIPLLAPRCYIHLIWRLFWWWWPSPWSSKASLVARRDDRLLLLWRSRPCHRSRGLSFFSLKKNFHFFLQKEYFLRRRHHQKYLGKGVHSVRW